jgi:hypothetical protein
LTLIPNNMSRYRRSFALLAPKASDVSHFKDVTVDLSLHRHLLAEAQRLRGKSYLELGALDSSQLTNDGRHVYDVDDRSWHLLTLDDRGQVLACLRYLAHPSSVLFPDLVVAHSELAKSETWGPTLRTAIEHELRQVRRRGCSYVEMGGWAIADALRCTTEALKMIVTAYALAQLSGGALGLTSATLRSCSASILRRIGGRRLAVDGVELPAYSDAQYRSIELEILSFDSSSPNLRYRRWMEESQAQLKDMPVIRQVADKPQFNFKLTQKVSFGTSQFLGELA